ncbi:MAG: PEP-CTERM sorting domain-containing protein [Planctomycetes bacterium]|nr:PEP-CTERM sorting domain-containing protein [Planctomycetota bacterium]MBU4397761.1 PEP-CTERM sorting domain-containing protein [Planctomycetota bacterium]MCG2683821.1 PEP-CTERM sorting domain-containing protein [Planctomycetales bacterium]
MRSHILCVLAVAAVLTCGLSGSASADIIIYQDDFPGTTLGADWTFSQTNGTVTVADSKVVLSTPGGGGWNHADLLSTTQFTASQDATFTFKLGAHPYGPNSIFGLSNSRGGGMPGILLRTDAAPGYWELYVGDGTTLDRHTVIPLTALQTDETVAIHWNTAGVGVEVRDSGGTLLYTIQSTVSPTGPLGFSLLAGSYEAGAALVNFDSVTVTVIPEPSTLALLATGLLGLLCYAWRKRK